MKRIVLIVTIAVALAAAASGVAAAPVERASLLSVESQFMCVSCHEPLQLVSSPQAIAEKQVLAGLVDRGDTPGQIKQVMVSNYGVAVLAKPPAHGFNLTVYVLPPAILLVGLAFLIYTLPKWRERSRQAAQTPMEGAAPLNPDEAERLDDELARFI